MRLRDRMILLADRVVSTLQWWGASSHLRTDPACVEHVAPRAGSRLDRRSRGVSCTRCMALRAFGRLPASADSGTSDTRETSR